MELKGTQYHTNMVSGRNWSAHVEFQGRQTTDFGKTEQEAIENAKLKITKTK